MKELYAKYERYLMPAMLIAGLAVDFLTFKSIRVQTALTILAVYFVVAGLAIAYIHYYDAPGLLERPRFLKWTRLAAQLAVQFAFGALLSASFIFYWFSGDISVSWPFIFLIAFLMVSNDVFRHYYSEPIVQISVYYFVAFSLFSLALPVLFNSIAVWLFVYAGILSLVFIFMYIGVMARLVEQIRRQRYLLAVPILLIYVAMNGLYFFNLIPPIPLSLREAGVYHNVQRAGTDYVLQAERESFWQRIVPGQTMHIAAGGRVYVFTAIYAPAALNIKIHHDWQYYDEVKGDWVSKDKLSFAITGGRAEGFRGYTTKSSVTPGTWRVDVKTERGQVIGRVKFTVEKVEVKPELEEVRR